MKGWLALTTAVVFSAGLAAGFVAARVTTTHRPGEGRPGGPPFGPNDPLASMITSEEVFRELGLDEGQKEAVTRLVKTHENRVVEVLGSFKTLADDLKRGIEDVLTPEQEARFETLRRDRAEREMRFRLSQEVVELKKRLELTAEEERAVHEILAAYAQRKRDLFQESKPMRDECWPKLRAERDEKMKAALPAAKYEAWKAFREGPRRGGPGDRDRGGDRRPRGDGPGPGAPPPLPTPAGGSTPPAPATTNP